MAMELAYNKLIVAISMSIVTFASSTLPLLIVRRNRNGNVTQNYRVVSFLSCFGGGVFLGTCLLHLFPDVKDQMVLVFETLGILSSFPIAEFLLGFGFLTVLTVEQIVLNYKENNISEEDSILSHQHSHGGSYQNYGTVNQSEVVPNNNGSHSVHPEGFPEPNEISEPHNHEVSFHQDRSSHSVLRSLLLIFALSLHSIFEGLAIGLQSSAEKVIQILLAVLIHKCIIAFTLGLNLTHSRLNRSNIIRGLVFFSLTSPVGIVIGVVVVGFVSGVPLMITSGVLQGLAAGTFLYVTFFEVLPHELNSTENRLIKLGCIIMGFSVISVLMLFLPD